MGDKMIRDEIEQNMYDEKGNEIYKTTCREGSRMIKDWHPNKVEIKFNKDNRDSALIKDLDKILAQYGYENGGFYFLPNETFIYEYSKGKSGLAEEVTK